ncbi:unnamed protein product [Lactuca virosa]|uniref:Uncharacterized protein n=1 Tax=Lactuca virosa TaxID=75947 RepID=A0AAU9LXH7_9ASTR|nr:unnamed protein product [Lactuca virosa]
MVKILRKLLCVAAICTYQLEALRTWNHIESTSFNYFEQDNNWTVPAEEAVRECNVDPTTHCIIRDRIRSDER